MVRVNSWGGRSNYGWRVEGFIIRLRADWSADGSAAALRAKQGRGERT